MRFTPRLSGAPVYKLVTITAVTSGMAARKAITWANAHYSPFAWNGEILSITPTPRQPLFE